MKWLIYGGYGWIGTQLCDLLEQDNTNIVIKSDFRVENTSDVEKQLLEVSPDNVVCLIGRTHGEGYTTIDYLEQQGKLKENINDNLFCPLALAMLCKKHNIHLTYLGTGCIFSPMIKHFLSEYIESSKGYDEDAVPDFFGSSYSIVKGFTDRLMHLNEDSVLNARIRMPIVGYHHVRNFITKITKYEKVINIHNSMTVLDDMLPILIDLASKKHTGTINLTNPGSISHNEVLSMYKYYVDNSLTWENFTLEEQDTILDSKRSNNKLDTSKLELLYPNVKNIKDSLENLFKNWNKK